VLIIRALDIFSTLAQSIEFSDFLDISIKYTVINIQSFFPIKWAGVAFQSFNCFRQILKAHWKLYRFLCNQPQPSRQFINCVLTGFQSFKCRTLKIQF
jgi:hypothetical protein